MSLDDPGLAPVAPRTEYPLGGPTSSKGLAQAAPARVGERQTLSYGDFSLTQDQHTRLANFLQQELNRALDETREFREALATWRLFVDPKDEPKDYPWDGASNVFVPIPRTVLDALKASVKQTVNRQLRKFVAEIDAGYAGIDESDVPRAQNAAVKFAELISGADYLNLSRTLDEEVEELLVGGIGPLRLTSERDERRVVTRGGAERNVVFRAGPRLTVIPLDFWMWPAGLWRNVQEMPWVGQMTPHTPASLRLRAQPPWNYRNVEEVLATRAGAGADANEQQRESAIKQMAFSSIIHTYEIELVWDVYGDGKFHDILVTFNLDTGLIHRIIYNPLGDGLKSYDVEVGSPRSGTIFGRGIIEPIVQPCRGINTAVNQTFDAQTLANAPCILYPEGSAAADILRDGFAPGLPIPYKENIKEIDVLKFPDPSATSFQMVQFFLQIVERLTRVGPNRLGEISAGRRTPASLGLASQQLGAELIDEMIDRLRDTLGRLWARAFILYLDEDPTIFTRLLGDEDGVLLRQIVERSRNERQNVQEALHIRLYASSATRSQELERQNAIAVTQLTSGWFRQVIELVQLYLQPGAPPQARDVLLDVLKSSQEQMRRIVALSNQPDAANLIPDVAERLESIPPSSPLPTAPGGPPPPPGASVGAGAGGGISPDVLHMAEQLGGNA